MKHILKRFLLQLPREELVKIRADYKDFEINDKSLKLVKQVKKGQLVYLGTEDDELFG